MLTQKAMEETDEGLARSKVVVVVARKSSIPMTLSSSRIHPYALPISMVTILRIRVSSQS